MKRHDGILASNLISWGGPVVLAFFAGCIAVSGWAPLAWWPISLACYAAFFFLLFNTSTIQQSVAVGLAFAIGLHGTGTSWIYTALHDKVHMGALGAWASTCVFILYVAAFTALSSALFFHLQSTGIHRLRAQSTWAQFMVAVHFSSAFALGEYGRTLLFNGFTSLSLGFSLVDTWFAGFAPVGGIYLVSWIGFLIAALSAQAVRCRAQAYLSGSFLVAVVSLVVIGYALSTTRWVQPIGQVLSFRLLQLNLRQEAKDDPHAQAVYANHLTEVIEQHAANIIATPETALPAHLHHWTNGQLGRLQAFSNASSSHLMVGTTTIQADAQGFNTILHLAPQPSKAGDDMRAIQQYQKVRLMPFGEYSPTGFSWFTRNLSISNKELVAGPATQNPFVVEGQRIGLLICQEDMDAAQARYWVQGARDASILLNPSNFAWFDGTLALEQWAQIVQMRALEVGRPILRVANTGVTVHINPFGNVVQRLPTSEEGVLIGNVQGYKGSTWYARWGEIWLLVLIVLLGAQHLRHGH